MQSENLIEKLIDQTKQIISQTEMLKDESINMLSWRETENSWNILECLEHLNLYGDFYLPAIDNSINKSVAKPDAEFRSGLLGAYFAKSMLPGQKMNKMSTFKDKNPLHAKLDKQVIDKFCAQQIKLLELLERSGKVSLNKVKVPTSISRLISLKLGDTFQFYINHIIRHLSQIERIKAASRNVQSTMVE